MLLQIVTTLVHIVTVTPVHTAPAPIAPTVTTVSTVAGQAIDKGFDVLALQQW